MTLSTERCLKFIGKRIFFQDDNDGTYLNRGIVIYPDPFQIDALVCIVEPSDITNVVRFSDIYRTEDLSVAELLTHENENVRKFGLERMAPRTNN